MIAGIAALTAALFTGRFNTYVDVVVMSQRSGLVMEPGAKVRMRGVQVGRVAGVEGGNPVRMRVELFPDQVALIPQDVQAEVRSTTAFGAKYLDFIGADGIPQTHIRAGTVVMSRNVTTEVNTVFENLVDVLHTVDPPKLNATLAALAEAVRGQGSRIGEATSAANEVLAQLNPLMDTARGDWVSVRRFADAYDGAANNLIDTLDAAATSSRTIVDNERNLDALLLNVIGFAQSGISLIEPNRDNLVQAVNGLAPTTGLLHTYSPSYTCMLLGAKWYLDHGGRAQVGGNGRTIVLDSALNLGDDPYRYPDNLPIVAAKGGPGGKPGCGSLPDVSKQFPVRQLITNTGWGTGVDIRPNPGIGHPWWLNLFPVTRAVPEQPSLHGEGPPAIGPVPYPGAPPYEPLPPPPDAANDSATDLPAEHGLR
ncbi:MCE family protein [Mycolicibacterium helvum]|uniref:MCE family protein n=1 Tax=Mycolicibacterium helvum TaxID=1534349 RepID=UPI001FE3129E|nr:MCE family protein [Mycolicibacterium helvum]